MPRAHVRPVAKGTSLQLQPTGRLQENAGTSTPSQGETLGARGQEGRKTAQTWPTPKLTLQAKRLKVSLIFLFETGMKTLLVHPGQLLHPHSHHPGSARLGTDSAPGRCSTPPATDPVLVPVSTWAQCSSAGACTCGAGVQDSPLPARAPRRWPHARRSRKKGSSTALPARGHTAWTPAPLIKR